MICEYCGFDNEDGSLYAEGSPCGINGCPIFTCCFEKWEEHKFLYHNKKIGIKNE